MTQYKNGDKVLVEFEIIRMSDCGASVQLEWPNKHNITVLNTDDIHSIAPEFKFGDEVEYRFYGTWDKGIYTCLDNRPEQERPYLINKTNGFCSNEFVWCQDVRKIPKPDDTMIWKDGKRYKLVEVGDEN